MNEEQFDVVIVGARCAGSATARLLAQAGLRVLVLDKAAFPSDTVSTHGVGPMGMQLLDRWGLLAKVLETDVPREDSVSITLGGTETQMQAPPGAFTPICPRRTVLDDILVQAARAAGAEVRERATCKALIFEDGAVAGVTYSDKQDRRHDVRARLVIGADGTGSFVARAVKARRYHVRASRVSFHYAYYAGIPIKRVEMAWSHPNFAYVFPTNDGLACMAAATDDAGMAALAGGGDAAMVTFFESASSRLGEALRGGTRRSRFYNFRHQPGRFVMSHGAGWALVGDAAYFKDPVTGQGISDAFAGAQLLADAVIEGFAKPAAMQEALAQYQSRRDELFAAAYSATQRLASLDWRDEDLAAIRDSYAPSPEKISRILGFTQVSRVKVPAERA